MTTIEGEVVETTAVAVRREEAPPAPTSIFAAMRPAERIALGTEIADALKGVLDAKGLIVRIPGKNGVVSEHVKAEGWQTCASLCGIAARIASTTKTSNGYEARAEAVRIENGVVIGAGEACCTKDEKRWQYADEYAVKSMAQTRAVSKALRGVLAWVIVLAGYNPTPAEEVPPGGFDNEKPEKPAKPDYDHEAAARQIRALAAERGIKMIGNWLVKNVAPDLLSRPQKGILSKPEADKALAMLSRMPSAVDPMEQATNEAPPAPERLQPKPSRSQQFTLMGLMRKAFVEAYPDKTASEDSVKAFRRHVYQERCGKGAFEELTAAEVAALIEEMQA
jgi:hypothetical protein